MYDAKKVTKDEKLKYNTVADRGYFGRISYSTIVSTPVSYVPFDFKFKK